MNIFLYTQTDAFSAFFPFSFSVFMASDSTYFRDLTTDS